MTIFDIHKRIVEILKTAYADTTIKVITSDKMEDIDSQRPCFKVDVEPILSEPVMVGYATNQTLVAITYFPSVDFSRHSLREKLENMYDELNSIFALNFFIHPLHGERTSLLIANKDYREETESAYLTFTFDLEYYTAIKPDRYIRNNEEVPVSADQEINQESGLTSDEPLVPIEEVRTTHETIKE